MNGAACLRKGQRQSLRPQRRGWPGYQSFPIFLLSGSTLTPGICITLMSLSIFSAGLRYPQGVGGPQSLAWVSPGSQLRRWYWSVSQPPHFLVSWKSDREERKSGPSSFGLPQPRAHPSVIPGTSSTSSSLGAPESHQYPPGNLGPGPSRVTRPRPAPGSALS